MTIGITARLSSIR